MKRTLEPWRILSRTPLVERTFVRVFEDRVRLGDGREIDDFCVIESPDWAATLCITPEGEVALVRQYRHGMRAESWELPAGALEPGENPLEGAKRELREETGYTSGSWQPLLVASIDPSRQVSRAHFFVALDAHLTDAPALDATEDLDTVMLSKAELLALVDRGELVHGIHLAAILMAVRRGLL